jgi:hypothetical protein
MFKTILVLALTFCMPAFAKRGQGGGGGKKGNPACAPIRAACEKAGYKAGRSGGGGGPAANAPKGQSGDSPGTIRECLTKWAAGGTIPGLMIRPSDPSAKECAEHMKERNSGGNNNGGKGGRRGGGKGGPGGPGGPNGHPGYGNSAPHPATPGAKATPPAANSKAPAPMAPKNPNPAAPAVLPPVPTTPPPKKP